MNMKLTAAIDTSLMSKQTLVGAAWPMNQGLFAHAVAVPSFNMIDNGGQICNEEYRSTQVLKERLGER